MLAKSRVVDTLAEFFGLKPKTSEEYDGVVGVSKTRLSKTDGDGLVPEEEDDVNAVVDERKHEAAIVIAASAVKHDCDELS